MQVLSKKKAVDLLKKSIDETAHLPDDHSTRDEQIVPWDIWVRTLRNRCKALFPADSEHLQEIEAYISKIESTGYASRKKDNLPRLIGVLKAYLIEIEELWSDDPVTQEPAGLQSELIEKPASSINSGPDQSTKVFIVHGHDHGKVQTIARFIDQIGLQSTILHEQAEAIP